MAVGERAELQSLGVNTYVAPSACRSVAPPKVTWGAVFGEIYPGDASVLLERLVVELCG